MSPESTYNHFISRNVWTLPGNGLFADEWDSLVWQRWGCFLDMCRCRLLVPPLSCNVLKQMRQRTAAKSSNRSKWLQIQLCLRPTVCSSTFWWSSTETSWAALWIPVIADIVSATFIRETLSELPSSIDTLKKVCEEEFNFQMWSIIYKVMLLCIHRDIIIT